jgi:hypothetical protein
MTRYMHFVGSLPPELMTSDGDMMEWFVERSKGHPLTGVPCDIDATWIVQYLRDREKHLDAFEVVRKGGFADYTDMPVYAVRRGHKLEPRDVSMDRIGRIREAVMAFRKLQDRHPELAGTRVQISQPSPLDMALYVFAGAAVADGLPLGLALRNVDVVAASLRHLPVFVQAVIDEISALVAEHGDILKWQVETPIAQLGMVKAAQLRAEAPVGRLLARQLAVFLARVHGLGAETVHLCYGNYRRKQLLSPRNIAPTVQLLNPTARLLRKSGVPLPPVHIPCAYGASPAPLDPAFYQPLHQLDSDWQVIAGVVSETSADNSIQSLKLFEEASERTVYGVATTCGLGRCTVDDAEQAAAATATTAAAKIPA